MIPQPFDQVPLLASLSQEERELVTARLNRRQVASGEIIFAAGEASDALYIIVSGWVRLEDASSRAMMLANLGPGSLLGEVDTLLGRPYTTSARASSPAQLQTCSRTDLQDLISRHPSIGLKLSAALGMRVAFLEPYLVHQRLRNIQLLSSLSEDHLRAIAQNLSFLAIARGELIVEAGTPGESAYLVEEGQIRLVSNSNQGESYEDLKPGDLFGHTTLITGKSHPATARAVTNASLWVLQNSVYQDIVRQHPAVKVAFSRTLAESLAPNDQVEAVDRIRQLPFFSDVSTEALHALVSRLVLHHYPTNEVVYADGTPGDAMYIVESGEVRLLDSSAQHGRLLERVRAGQSFGEMALLTGRTRAECVRAATDATIWVLYKADFDDLMVRYPEVSLSLSRALTDRLGAKENDFLVRHLRHIHLLSNLATSELRAISNKVKGLRFRPGEIICFSGQAADNLYMIEMGEVKRFGVGLSGEPVLLDLLGPGDSFGEQAIVQNSPYTATAQAIGELELWTISRDDFIALMEQYPSLAMTVTRIMADRLAKSQSAPGKRPAPTTRPQRGAPPPAQSKQNLPPQNRPSPPQQRSTRPMAPVNVPRTPPPPAAAPSQTRIQRPPSGARPIRPAGPPPDTSRPAVPVSQPKAAPPVVVDRPKPPHKSELQAPPVPHHHADHHHATVHPAQALTQAPTNGAAKARPSHAAKQHHESNSPLTEVAHWAGNLSLGAKIRAVAIIVFLVWIALIALPATAISAITSAVGGIQLIGPAPSRTPLKTSTAAAKPVTQASTNAKVAIAAALDTPTPTRTSIPPTKPPTATRRPATATATRAPNTPAPAIIAPPSPTAAAVVQVAAAATLPPIYWDQRLGNGSQVLPRLENVRLIPAAAAPGQKFWRAISVKFEDVSESGNDHTIYVQVKDENGKRIDGKVLLVTSDSTGEVFPNQPSEKPASDLCDCNFSYPMWGDGYNVIISGDQPSDKVAGMIMPLRRHVNYRVAYQLTTNP